VRWRRDPQAGAAWHVGAWRSRGLARRVKKIMPGGGQPGAASLRQADSEADPSALRRAAPRRGLQPAAAGACVPARLRCQQATAARGAGGFLCPSAMPCHAMPDPPLSERSEVLTTSLSLGFRSIQPFSSSFFCHLWQACRRDVAAAAAGPGGVAGRWSDGRSRSAARLSLAAACVRCGRCTMCRERRELRCHVQTRTHSQRSCRAGEPGRG